MDPPALYEPPTSTIFQPSVEQLDIFLDGDWRDRPASKWAIACSGTLQAKIEAYCRFSAHRRPSFLHGAQDVPFYKMIEFANLAFGYDGWSTEVLGSEVESLKEDGDRYSLRMLSTVRVTLKDGTYHEAAGAGRGDNLPQKSLAFSKAKKESVTAATKNCFLQFADLVLDHQAKMEKGFYSNGGMFEFLH
ncbi:CYFA0S02e04698g1_1 [Cyberlindnera fabianii]|uniref:CYFA0S02e04698g1_1 n=1 Tax=Cyberlindnera fabianii TaxID=36022 RepID=A0A061ATI8_CYBFA|nr:DNA repair protein RAD59 [Cyberlindnera fabianii]CDR38700.1 CYFA0S02e04698g1_1 [Cyberlindnera fabianii]